MHAPEPFQAMKRGWAVVEDLGRLDIAFQNSCAATTRRMMRKRSDIAFSYVRAFCQGVYRLRTDAAFGIEVLRKYTGEPDPTVIEQTWVLFSRLMGGMMFPSLEGVRTAIHVLNRLGAIAAPVAPERVVDLSPVAALEREGFFARLMGAHDLANPQVRQVRDG
jgi:NitT/TauT family transport system substrate-binding protein